MTATITYKITKYSDKTDKETVDEGIRQGFNLWADVTPLTFQQTVDDDFDIEIEFTYNNHTFLKDPTTCGVALFNQQRIFLNDRFYWSLDAMKQTVTKDGLNLIVKTQNLPVITAHEFGHLRGLIHNSDDASIMKPGNPGVSRPSRHDIDSMNEVLRCNQ